MDIMELAAWGIREAPLFSQFAVLAWIIIRQQKMIEHCRRWDKNGKPED